MAEPRPQHPLFSLGTEIALLCGCAFALGLNVGMAVHGLLTRATSGAVVMAIGTSVLPVTTGLITIRRIRRHLARGVPAAVHQPAEEQPVPR